ncbi:MAG TPA: AI-2E family transporter [Actinomycetota bacterium]|jgi:predicted PurR-regulated permease PerM|nr:AI-2E family transporter [Actinomycetota bacterium]
MDPAHETAEKTEPPVTEAQARGAQEVRRRAVIASPSGMPTWIPKLLLQIVFTVFAAYAAFSIFRRLRDLVVWLITALFLSFALEPGVNWLVGRGWRRGAATAVLLFALALLVVVIIALMVPLVIDQVQELVQRLPGFLAEASVYTERWFDIELTSERLLEQIAGAQTSVARLAANVASIGAFLVSVLFQLLTIGLFTFYLVADGPRFRRVVCSLLPPRRQREVLSAWEVAIDKTGGYLYSRLLLAVINAAFTYVVLRVLGVPFALPLAIWQGFVSQFIPVVGTYIAAAVPLLVALLEDPIGALFFLIFVLVYQQIENYLLAPRITARTMQLHPAVAFGAALAGGSINGLLGAFIALPAAAVIQATVSTYLTRHEVIESQLTREDETTLSPAEIAGTDEDSDKRESGIMARMRSRLRRNGD